MKLNHEDHGHMTILNVRGELAAEDIEPFVKQLRDRLAADIRDFVLDFSQLAFIDSKGLETLIWLQDEVGDRLGQVRLVQINDDIKTILEMTRLSSRFECHGDVESAKKSLV